jgi:hypothetical protein
MPNGEMTFEEFMKVYPQFDETFIKTMMGKGLKIRVDPEVDKPVYQGMSKTIFVPPQDVGGSVVIEHEMAHATSSLDPKALRTAGFTAPQVFLGGIRSGVGMETPGGFARGMASIIAPNLTSRLSESLAISAAGQGAYPDFTPMGERRQF